MRRLIVMAGFFSSIARVFGAAPSESEYKPAQIYVDLRAQVLALRADQIDASDDNQIVAVLMETGYPEAVATLVAVADGSASLYFSNGGGIIGGGENERPNAAAKKLIHAAAGLLSHFTKTDAAPLPKKEFTRFYVVTRSGNLTAEVKEEILGEGDHTLSPLFYAAHELITEIRVIDEQRQKKG